MYCISQIYYNFTCREQYTYKFIRKFQYIYKRISIKLDAFSSIMNFNMNSQTEIFQVKFIAILQTENNIFIRKFQYIYKGISIKLDGFFFFFFIMNFNMNSQTGI